LARGVNQQLSGSASRACHTNRDKSQLNADKENKRRSKWRRLFCCIFLIFLSFAPAPARFDKVDRLTYKQRTGSSNTPGRAVSRTTHINGNIKTLLRRGCGYKNLSYLLRKAQPMAVTMIEFIVLQKAA
jgi:hypothetical protein